MKRKSKPAPPPISLTREELRTFFKHARKVDFVVYVLMLVQYWHAGRNSEMIHLKRDNFVDGFIRYKRGKNSEPCLQRLVEHEDDLFNEKEVVTKFVLNLSGNQRLYPRSRWTYWRHLVKLAKAAGISRPKAKTTVLKHSIVTHVMEKYGVNVAQRRAGHVNGASTLRYARVTEEHTDKLVAAGIGL
jgi:integrase